MVQKKVITQTAEQILDLYKLHGKESKLRSNSGIESFMPENVIFGNVFFQDMPENEQMSHFRVETFDANDETKKGSVSVSRVHVVGVKKATTDTKLSENDLILRSIKKGTLAGKKTYMIAGKPINKVTMLSEDQTILNLQGKTFKAVKAERFNLPYELWQSKNEALDAANVVEYFDFVEVK